MTQVLPGTSGRRAVRWLAAVVLAVTAVLPAAATAPAAAGQEPDAAAEDAAGLAGAPTWVDWQPLPPPGWPTPPPATARSFLLLDAATGQVLAAREADEPRLVASTVKLLTILTALETLDPGQTIEVGPEVDAGVDGAGASVDPGERWSVDDLLAAIIVRSGNDAARALAGAVTGGDLAAFTERMEATADALGVGDDVTLTEPTGLDDGNRLTARALGVIARAALANPLVRAVAGQEDIDLPDVGTVPNRNLLVGRYAGVTGLKTGYTVASGWCLVASAERDGRELVAVVVGAHEDADRFDEAAALLDHGFETLAATDLPGLEARTAGGWQTLLPAGTVWAPAGAPVVAGLSGRGVGMQIEVVAGTDVLGTRTLDPPRSAAAGSVGAALVDTMYAAMRTAHRTGAWADPDGADTTTRSNG